MNIDIKQLEINVNLHALQSAFLNLELHYIIAKNENNFRFANWHEVAGANEQKFYCFLQEKELLIPAGNVLLKESYVVSTEPIYPVVKDCKTMMSVIKAVKDGRVANAVRQFSDEDFDSMKNDLQKEFASVEKHVVTSPSLQHHIFVVDDIEISVAPTMVYLRMKAPFAESHYKAAKNE